ncbi:MAG: trehalose-phosphatase [Gemmatimonadaceae bacterium]
MTHIPPAPQLDWAWFFDIDGTLASIEMSPDAVRVDGVMQYLIEVLHEKTHGAVALVSGRSLRDIDKLFPNFTLAAAGQHGAERRHANGIVARQPVPSAQLLAMRDALREMERRHAGLMLEDKGLSLSMHYRQVPRLGAFVQREVRALFMQMGSGFHIQLGKCVVEIVPTGHSKGSVITEFLAEAPFSSRVPAFLGDDVTDENAFAVVNALGGISIKVGAGPTLAPYRLSDVPAVRDWLASLSSLTVLNHSEAGDAA